MKIKVSKLLNQKQTITRQLELLETLDACDSDKTLSTLHIHEVDAETLKELLTMYKDLISAILDSGEVVI